MAFRFLAAVRDAASLEKSVSHPSYAAIDETNMRRAHQSDDTKLPMPPKIRRDIQIGRVHLQADGLLFGACLEHTYDGISDRLSPSCRRGLIYAWCSTASTCLGIVTAAEVRIGYS
jgi:hypothetical protein